MAGSASVMDAISAKPGHDAPVLFTHANGESPSMGAPKAVARIQSFLRERPTETPCLVVDLETVRERYCQLTAALPKARVYYAVKANPAAEVVRELAAAGSCFDVASVAEIELCLAAGANPRDLCYGNTIKKPADVAKAHALGVRLYTTDSETDLEALSEHAPGSSVFCRIAAVHDGAVYSFGAKFGCAPELAESLLLRAGTLGLAAAGVSFHSGSQQLDPHAWRSGIAHAAQIAARLAAKGVRLPMLNIGGGLPGSYTHAAPPLADYADAISAAVREHFGAVGLHEPLLVLEPGRYLVADAGLLRSEVVLVSRKSPADEHRWVYVDAGRYNGLTETEGECVAYVLASPEHAGPAAAEDTAPVYLAGPTCDGDDVLYQRTVYRLPSALRVGDHLDFLSTGAYTASYASIAFNGFSPLKTLCI
ncbi:Orn/DAP/Arg decarboxylase 2 [Segniliparus rotundus DSM 44985]|uniref:ornithine decarboxylase n=1 Tax=Segniliparus rotundus (strain ATCC BAA-972 / CDC 1076 / CIP 108378 / DSM 44985 / JCM 13578) TaxID=640132 RepID=D6Z9V6_SEGRD|nr:type III PLP-dependent enzyme [Segniliparus rotundus]ADG98626.1 Orn/DAP/Arg decarboxylase 2 [Segniliparus rotundus DSM 44985]